MPRHVYVLTLVISAGLSALLAFFGWRRRSVTGAASLALLMLAAAQWSLGYALQIASVDLTSKVLWGKVSCLGIVFAPVTWLAFVLQYTGRGKWLTRRNVVLLAIEPLASLLLLWTNEAHGLVCKDIRLNTTGPFPTLDWTDGVWMWIDTAYSYLLVLVSTFLLVQALIRSPHPHRRQVGVLLIGAFAPWMADALSIFGLNPLAPLYLTPFAFTLTGLAFAWGILHFRLLGLVPVAREAVIESMSDGVIVLDAQNRIVDLNPAAVAIGQLLPQVLPVSPDFVERYGDTTKPHKEIVLGEGRTQRTFDPRISPLYDQHGNLTGRLVVLRDITERERAERLLQALNAAARSMEQALTPEEIFSTVAGKLKKLGFSCLVLLTDESKERLFLTYRSYEAKTIQAAERLVGLKTEDFPIFVKTVDEYRGVVWERETVFIENEGEIVRQLLQPVPHRSAQKLIGAVAGMLNVSVNISAPLIVGNKVVGMLAVQSAKTTDDMPAVTDFAHQMAAAWHKARLMQDLQENLAELKRTEEALRRARDELETRVQERTAELAQVNETSRAEIAERQRAEEALRKYAFIANTSKESMTLISKECVYEAVNESYCKARNKTRQQMLGTTVADAWGRETYVTRIKEPLDSCFAGNETNHQAWFQFPGVGQRFFDVTYYPYYGDGRTVTHAAVASRDITERRRAEKALQNAHAQNQQLLASISSILIDVSPDDRITHWNVPAETAFGMAAADVMGRPFVECGIRWGWSEITRWIAKQLYSQIEEAHE